MTTQPRGLRNNNPGNIRNSDATDWQGEVPASKNKTTPSKNSKTWPTVTGH